MYTQAQQRMVLFEEFTGESCPPCAQVNPSILNLVQNNTDKVIMIKYQVPIPRAGGIYNEYKIDTDNRMAYYQPRFAPYGRLDGGILGDGLQNAGHAAYLNQARIDQRAGVAAPFDVTVSHRWTAGGDSIHVTVDVNCVSAYSGNLKLRVALVENLHFTTPPGTNGEKEFHNVVRKMYPTGNGTAINGTWNPGDQETFEISGEVPAHVVNRGMDARIVVWIQNDTDKEIAQAAQSEPVFPESVDALVTTGADKVKVYPNPASDVATVAFTLKAASTVRVQLVDATGKVVKAIVNKMEAGAHQVELNTTGLAAGMYFVNLQAGKANHSEAISVVK